MNKRQVGILWIIAVVLAAVASFLLFRSPEDEGGKTKLATGDTLLKDFAREDVAKIAIKAGDKSATLVRKGDKWTVSESADYPASTASINDLLIELKEVKVAQGMQCDPAASAPRFGMDPSSSKDEEKGVEAVFSNEAGSEMAHLSFGKNIESASESDNPMEGGAGAAGRFVRDHTDSSGVYKVSTVFPTLSADAKTWLDHKFFAVEKPLSITVSKSGKPDETEWKVTRPDEQAEFTLDGAKAGEVLDTTLANTLKTLMAYSQFEDVLTAEAAAKLADANAKRTVKIDTAEGFHYTVTLTPVTPTPAKEGEPPATATDVVLTVDVAAEIPAERKKEANESAEDAKTKDATFTERKTALEKKLADEKVFAGRFFKVAQSSVADALKDRPALIKAPEAPAAAGNPPQGGLPRLPGSGPGLSGATPVQPRQPRRPVEAVTPPIAIPPMDERAAATPKPEEAKPEQPKPEEVKPEEPKLEQPKIEDAKPEMPKTEEVKPEQPKPEEPKLEQPKQEGQ